MNSYLKISLILVVAFLTAQILTKTIFDENEAELKPAISKRVEKIISLIIGNKGEPVKTGPSALLPI